MSTEVKLPELGENIESGDLVRLLVKVGDRIQKDQAILELETDKATIEVPSPAAGTVQEIRVKEGDKIKIGQAVLVLDDGAAKAEAPAKAFAPPAPKPAPAKAAAPAAPAPKPASPPGGVVEVKVPEMGENVTSGDLVKILVKVGDQVSKDQGIVEVETDKATIEVPSSAAGTVREIRVKEGQKIQAGDTILVLEGASVEAAVAAAPVAPPAAEPVAAAPAPAPSAADAPAPARVSLPTPSAARGTGRSAADIPAGPSVRALAREIGVEITEVQGSGPGGRLTRDDVKRHARERSRAAGTPAAAAVPLPDFAKWGAIERQAMTSIRRATARSMGYAWTVPHVTQNDKADITNVEKLREKFAERAKAAGGKLTMTAIALKIVAAALHQFPKFAASIDLQKEEIIFKKYIHIGIAVDTERGLLVPVIRDVDKKNIIDLSVELAQVAQKAKDRKLRPEDLEGGVFTITNLGGIGGGHFSPIIYAPQVAILGMGRSGYEPFWSDNQWKPRLMLPLSLSYDHRVIDGAEAARFLRWLADAFEQPFLLALEG